MILETNSSKKRIRSDRIFAIRNIFQLDQNYQVLI